MLCLWAYPEKEVEGEDIEIPDVLNVQDSEQVAEGLRLSAILQC